MRVVPLGVKGTTLQEGASKLSLGTIGVREVDSPWLGTKTKRDKKILHILAIGAV